MSTLLEIEINTYFKSKENLLKEHEGEFVLIHGTDIIGTYPDQVNALKEGGKRFSGKPFLVRQIAENEPVLRYEPRIMLVTS